MGSYKWGYKSPSIGNKYSYSNFMTTMNLQVVMCRDLFAKAFRGGR